MSTLKCYIGNLTDGPSLSRLRSLLSSTRPLELVYEKAQLQQGKEEILRALKAYRSQSECIVTELAPDRVKPIGRIQNCIDHYLYNASDE